MSHQKTNTKNQSEVSGIGLPFENWCAHLYLKLSYLDCDKNIPFTVQIRTQTGCQQNIKLRTAKSQKLPTKDIVTLTLFPFRDHRATQTIFFAIADTKYSIHKIPFHQTYRKTFNIEHLCLILKQKMHKTNPLKKTPVLQSYQKQQPFFSKVST